MNSQNLKCLVIACCLLVLSSSVMLSTALADISLPKIFTDHMVLQQNSKVKIWGSAEPAQKLIVKFDGKEYKLTANQNGDWSTSIITPPAGGPYELEVAAEKSEPKVVFSNVMVGEVWLCAGQCNMDFPVSSSLNAETEIDLSKNFPNIRLFTIGDSASNQRMTDFAKVEPWRVCSPEMVKNFSAAAYFFGRELSKELAANPDAKPVPIGLIDASWAGTFCEAWVSRKAMDNVVELAPLLKYWDENDDPTSLNRPGNLFNGMIAPLTSFPVRGVIWYQGEANVDRGHQYATLLPTLIKDWRNQFGVGEMPFYFVQLAPYRYKQKPPEALAEIWDAQLRTFKSVPRTRMIVTTDVGDLADINPKNKQVIGRRLAVAALTDVYLDRLPEEKQNLEFSGPIYEAMSTNQSQVRLTFKHAKGLRIPNDETELTGFLVCGEDKVFVPAVAKITGEQVEVSSPEVENPIAVRFNWDDSAQPNLVNEQGLPASPFRTDDFPLISLGRDF